MPLNLIRQWRHPSPYGDDGREELAQAVRRFADNLDTTGAQIRPPAAARSHARPYDVEGCRIEPAAPRRERLSCL